MRGGHTVVQLITALHQ